ncbi:High-affinity nickel transport protein [Leucoagaricus sp. SymC.cos]|nr:High-affinity nickel transport protein [Leucoagaricus sp. SymC.cos]
MRFRCPLIHLTIFGRSLLLGFCEVLANAICWAVAAVLFRNQSTRSNLGLALLAWTLGLRHGLDADHISAIDNATRSLINIGQLPITCGLFFSLGHSSIVIAVVRASISITLLHLTTCFKRTIAIAISTDVYDRLNSVGEVGGIVGAAVSGSFLFIVGLANSFILFRILRQRRRLSESVLLRLIRSIMYPVGVLFGFGKHPNLAPQSHLTHGSPGFDTASSVALLAISAIAKQDSEGHRIPSSHVVILPLIFTAGMSLVDSLDSILMLWTYAGLLEDPHRWRIFERREASSSPGPDVKIEAVSPENFNPEKLDTKKECEENPTEHPVDPPQKVRIVNETKAKMNVMSGLSIILTLMSIMVAFAISLITIMSLIGEHCSQCIAAAEAEDGGGLAGAWWRGWANANEHSGFIGVGIVGAVVVIVASWYLGRWVIRRIRARRAAVNLLQESSKRC